MPKTAYRFTVLVPVTVEAETQGEAEALAEKWIKEAVINAPFGDPLVDSDHEGSSPIRFARVAYTRKTNVVRPEAG